MATPAAPAARTRPSGVRPAVRPPPPSSTSAAAAAAASQSASASLSVAAPASKPSTSTTSSTRPSSDLTIDRELQLRARAFAQFQLMLRCMTRWNEAVKTRRAAKQRWRNQTGTGTATGQNSTANTGSHSSPTKQLRPSLQQQQLETSTSSLSRSQSLAGSQSASATDAQSHTPTSSSTSSSSPSSERVDHLDRRALQFLLLHTLPRVLRAWFVLAQRRLEERAHEAAQLEREAKMERLLKAMGEKKRKAATAGADPASQEKASTTKTRRPTSRKPSSSSTSSPAASRSRSGSAQSRKHESATDADHHGRSCASNHASATATQAVVSSTESPSTNTATPAAASATQPVGYKARLMAERGKRTAQQSATAGAAAIAATSTTASSVPPVSLPSSSSTSTHLFSIASGETMSARAALRKARREELEASYAAARASRLAEAEARAEAERLRIEEEHNREATRKRELKRVQIQVQQAKARAMELEKEQMALARIHHERATMIYYGWRPWLQFLERTRIQRRRMQQTANMKTIRRCWKRWMEFIEQCRRKKQRLEEMKLARASRNFDRILRRRAFRQWATILQWRKQQAERFDVLAQRKLLKRSFRQLRQSCIASRQSREAKHARLEPSLRSMSSRVLRRHYFRIWMSTARTRRTRKEVEKKTQELQRKVGGWLEEFRAKKKGEEMSGSSAAASSYTSTSGNASRWSSTIHSSNDNSRPAGLTIEDLTSSSCASTSADPKTSTFSSRSPPSPSHPRASLSSHARSQSYMPLSPSSSLHSTRRSHECTSPRASTSHLSPHHRTRSELSSIVRKDAWSPAATSSSLRLSTSHARQNSTSSSGSGSSVAGGHISTAARLMAGSPRSKFFSPARAEGNGADIRESRGSSRTFNFDQPTATNVEPANEQLHATSTMSFDVHHAAATATSPASADSTLSATDAHHVVASGRPNSSLEQHSSPSAAPSHSRSSSTLSNHVDNSSSTRSHKADLIRASSHRNPPSTATASHKPTSSTQSRNHARIPSSHRANEGAVDTHSHSRTLSHSHKPTADHSVSSAKPTGSSQPASTTAFIRRVTFSPDFGEESFSSSLVSSPRSSRSSASSLHPTSTVGSLHTANVNARTTQSLIDAARAKVMEMDRLDSSSVFLPPKWNPHGDTDAGVHSHHHSSNQQDGTVQYDHADEDEDEYASEEFDEILDASIVQDDVDRERPSAVDPQARDMNGGPTQRHAYGGWTDSEPNVHKDGDNVKRSHAESHRSAVHDVHDELGLSVSGMRLSSSAERGYGTASSHSSSSASSLAAMRAARRQDQFRHDAPIHR